MPLSSLTSVISQLFDDGNQRLVAISVKIVLLRRVGLISGAVEQGLGSVFANIT